jgi:small subunit ribosomal protein S8
MSSISDPIADLLTRVRNGYMAKKDEVSVPTSKIKSRVAELLRDEGYIEDVAQVPDKQQGLLVLRLRYDEKGHPVLHGLKRESRPGRRVYVSGYELPKVRNGLGTAIISTSRGVMTDRKARREKVGGEYLCSIW